MRLLYITYKVNSRDTLVGHVAGWIKDLALCMDSIDVVCLAANTTEIRDNVRVHSLGKDHGRRKIARWINFYQTVWRLRENTDVVFCQFSPEYVLAIAPMARLLGWPIILWYTHRYVGWKLRLATRLADRIVTASPESFRISTDKMRVIGHGINTEQFIPSDSTGGEHPVILAVGRVSPIKNYELLIDALDIVVHQYGCKNLILRIVGGDEGNAPHNYMKHLNQRINRAGLTDVITLVGPVPHDQIVREYQHATINVNLCPTGGMDKAVLEGMAVGVPTLVRNQAFAAMMGTVADLLIIPSDNPQSIASHLLNLLNMSQKDRQRLGDTLRQIVTTNHDQKLLIKRLDAVVRESAAQ